MADVLKPESLAELLTFVLWTDVEFVEVLCGVEPGSFLHRRGDPSSDDLSARRAYAERHVHDAILRGELRMERSIADGQILAALEGHVEDLQLLAEIRRAVQATRMYEPRKIRPERAVAWALERRALFPACPLTREHLGIAVRAGAALREPGDPQTIEQLNKRARWLNDLMKERHMSIADVSGDGGPDRKTIQKVLAGEPVGSHVIEKLAKAFGVPVKEIP